MDVETDRALRVPGWTLELTPRSSAMRTYRASERPNETKTPQINRNTADDKPLTSDPYQAILRFAYASTEVAENIDWFDWLAPKRIVVPNSSSSIENYLNTRSVDELRREFSTELLLALKQDPVEPGLTGQADAVVEKCIAKNALATMTWLNELFLENYDRPTVASDILLLVGRLAYEVAQPAGVTMAISGLKHKNSAVQEAAIRALEYWASPKCLNILGSVQELHPKWLNDYLEDVKRDLKAICGEAG